jgi:SsrA-binding protein
MSKSDKQSEAPKQIAVNRRARYDYFIEQTFEAGMALEGWEVKSMRAGKANVAEAYVIIKDQEAWLLGAHIIPLGQASTHIHPDPTRTRKPLLQARQIAELIGKVERAGYTIVPLDLHWSRGRAKLQIGLAKGKKQHDKRADSKEKDWKREQGRIMRS